MSCWTELEEGDKYFTSTLTDLIAYLRYIYSVKQIPILLFFEGDRFPVVQQTGNL